MRVHAIRLRFLLILALASSPAVAADSGLLAAIRSGDSSAVKHLLQSGADANSRDETGATAVMYSAIYAPTAVMQLLLDRGADVNAANAHGSTALMWAAGDTAKVRLLLDRGARANAKSSDGATALVVAARYRNAEAVRLLLEHGADPKVPAVTELARAVFVPENDVIRELIAKAGFSWREALQSGLPLINLNVADPAAVEQLLSAGADPREKLTAPTMSVPTLALAARMGILPTVRALVERGADVNSSNEHGLTPLMLAAGADSPMVATVRFLLEKGADVRARDMSGRTALDWAILQGEGEVTTLLREAGAPAAPPILVPHRGSAGRRTTAEAVGQAVAMLQPAGPGFYDRAKCISCHNQSLPSIAVGRAAAHKVPVDATLASHATDKTLAQWAAARERLLLANPFAVLIPGMTYGLLGFAEGAIEPNAVTDAITIALAPQQHDDGNWGGGPDPRPPLGGGPAVLTALAIRSLAAYAPPGRQDEAKGRIARAQRFLRAFPADDTQDEVFRLLGFVWSHAAATEISASRARLLALQRADGGWGQRPALTSDAYATGQVLYALKTSGLEPMSAPYAKGVQYLRDTQLEDGTWHVRSRAVGIQRYFETGFPHGVDQFISTAATAWAAIALADALP